MLSDLLPILTQMLCIWITYIGEWNVLISDFLRPPSDGDTTTEAGSVMLDGLRAELTLENYHEGTERLALLDLLESDKVDQDLDIWVGPGLDMKQSSDSRGTVTTSEPSFRGLNVNHRPESIRPVDPSRVIASSDFTIERKARASDIIRTVMR